MRMPPRRSRPGIALATMAFVLSGCQEEAAPQQPDAPLPSAVCSENATSDLCGRATGCTWLANSCTTQSAAAAPERSQNNGNQTTATCASKTQGECSGSCHWESASGKCADGMAPTLGSGSSACAQFAANTLACMQAQAQGCTWNSHQCVVTNANGTTCQSLSTASDCAGMAKLGCRWNSFRCESTMVGSPQSQTASTGKSSVSGNNVMVVAGLGILATVLPVLLAKPQSAQSLQATVGTTPVNPAALPQSGGATNAATTALGAQCSGLDMTRCQANFAFCTWVGKACTGKQ